MSGRADEHPYEPPAPETGPAVTSANLAAAQEAKLDDERKVAEKTDEKPTKRGGTGKK